MLSTGPPYISSQGDNPNIALTRPHVVGSLTLVSRGRAVQLRELHLLLTNSALLLRSAQSVFWGTWRFIFAGQVHWSPWPVNGGASVLGDIPGYTPNVFQVPGVNGERTER